MSKIKSLISFFSYPIYQFLLSSWRYRVLTILPPTLLNRRSKHYFTCHRRPKLSEDINLDSIVVAKDIGIVIQGPINHNDSFTFETVLFYTRLIEPKNIVLSTWEGENTEGFDSLGVCIIKNVKPKFSGIQNSNFQITSTINGLNLLKERAGVKFALKTRTDQRIYNAQSFITLKRLLFLFPLAKSLPQNMRVILLNINTLKYKLFSASDMFQFGDIEDLIRMWDIKEINCNIPHRKPTDDNPEMIIMKNYLNRNGYPFRNSIDSYHQSLLDNYLIVDSEFVDFFWYKYTNQEYLFSKNYKQDKSADAFNYIDWLNLYLSKNLKHE